MQLPFPRLLFAILCISPFFTAKLAAQSPNPGFVPEKGDHIVLLGNTFADRMRHYNYFETLLQKSFPDKQLTLRNMGWSADEVGLQPRPLNFPGFGERTPRLTEGQTEIKFKSYTLEQEKIIMPVALNFSGLNQDLTDQKADIVFLCFGMNEAFKGPAGLPQFEKDLNAFIQNLQSNKYNGKAAPKLVLVSPIAHENLGTHFPNPAEHTKNLALYSAAMQKIAANKRLYFIDLFAPSLAKMQSKHAEPITINGIHLNDTGYRLAAGWMAQSLGFSAKPSFDSDYDQKLHAVIKMKDDHFFYRWRAVNGEYIYGRRREPFGVIAFPPELRKLNQMTTALDSVIWEMGISKNVTAFKKAMDIIDRRGKPIDPALLTDISMTGRQGEAAKAAAHEHHEKMWPATTEKFKLPKGYEINLFASEKDFPIEKPVAMNFDAKGRLWVATMPTYPQYFPGIPVHDKIVILEDTDGDGKADKHTVFADDLYLPLGFEFGNGGIFVAQEPDIVFLKDTNGDDKADVREVVLSGFGSEDSHHASHAFTYGQDGALYFNEGTFLNTQVETPYGPIRSYAGATYRFEPRTGKLSHYISYPYYNPWGSVFDKWGTHLIGDASDGSNYFAPPMTGKVNYPDKHPRINMFTETRVRPTAGIEMISSRQFPDDVQGDFLVNNNIGFQGTKQHRVIQQGSGILGKETAEALLQSSDPNFRPIDLEFGPDGGVYIADWYNPLISHGENPPRDPARDKSHGRIWRITYQEKPLLKRVDISKQSVSELLENLKVHEDRFRYRTRTQLREMSAAEVLPALKKWVATLNKNNPDYELHLLEALWIYQDFDVVEMDLLKTALNAKEPQARAAATKLVRFWYDHLPGALDLLKPRLNDESPRVRLEAIVAMSFLESVPAVTAALDVFKYPTDYYLDYAIHETFRHLKPVWLASLQQGKITGKAENYLLTLLNNAELSALPKSPAKLASILTRPDFDLKQKQDAVSQLAENQNTNTVKILTNAIRNEKTNTPAQNDLIRILFASDQGDLAKSKAELQNIVKTDTSKVMKVIAHAALISSDKSGQTGQHLAADKNGYIAQMPEIALPIYMDLTISNSTDKTQSTREFVASLETLPADVRNSAAFAKAIVEMKKRAARVPETDRKEVSSLLEAMGTLEISLNAIEAKMAFDKQELQVPAGRKVSLTFTNPDVMPHNVVIVKPGTEQKVGEAADAMANLKDGFEKNFIPNSTDILYFTPLVNSGQNFRLNFTAPAQAGNYPFICSFPGHWRVMQGILKVTEPPKKP
ncbi:PVC-type heme-binding CxxCH protein [Dyadobacter sp. CY323]|uniref:PVC-type heme-binding CxxCH protein n=1 Tax=Dyadobacter sp. CY323 TaxID=2907302 RepID=UPI001F165BDF|nr:PVC-type heme-binding CxxCH protein [Dyadobacter sp. CY323]MCE6988019.1 plastocyanin/azurin family copper-binding protein [Dyadobacter sp. CY323]